MTVMGMYRCMHNSSPKGVLLTKPSKANFIFYSRNAATAHIGFLKFSMNNKILQFCYTANHPMKVCNLKVLIKIFSHDFFRYRYVLLCIIYWCKIAVIFLRVSKKNLVNGRLILLAYSLGNVLNLCIKIIIKFDKR